MIHLCVYRDPEHAAKKRLRGLWDKSLHVVKCASRSFILNSSQIPSRNRTKKGSYFTLIELEEVTKRLKKVEIKSVQS